MEATEEVEEIDAIEEPETIDGMALEQIWRRRLTEDRYLVVGEFRGLWYLVPKQGAPSLELTAETIHHEFELIRDHRGHAVGDEGGKEHDVL